MRAEVSEIMRHSSWLEHFSYRSVGGVLPQLFSSHYVILRLLNTEYQQTTVSVIFVEALWKVTGENEFISSTILTIWKVLVYDWSFCPVRLF